MMTVVALAALAVAPPGPDPGRGTRLWSELGVARYSTSYEASRGDAVGKTGIDGFGPRLLAGLGFDLGSGFILGPTLATTYAFTRSSGGICCGSIDRVQVVRVGLEGSYYPSAVIGFRISAGFGFGLASLSGGQADAPLSSGSAIGPTWTIALARDYVVSRRSRIGAVLRLDSEALAGRDGDRVSHMRSFTPSLSMLFTSNLGT